LTVPACGRCNATKAADDTFLRDYLTADAAGHEHPVAANLFAGKVSRSVARNQSELARLVQKATRVEVPLLTPAGLLVGKRYGVSLPDGRVSSILFRIMRGLYFKCRKVVFPPDTPYEVLRHPLSEWDIFVREVFHDKPITVLGNVFACTCMHATEDPFTAAWLMCFYERLVFTSRTDA
jgi:hypothetical protein